MLKLSRNILHNLSGQLLLAGLSFVAVKYIFKQLGCGLGRQLSKRGLAPANGR